MPLRRAGNRDEAQLRGASRWIAARSKRSRCGRAIVLRESRGRIATAVDIPDAPPLSWPTQAAQANSDEQPMNKPSTVDVHAHFLPPVYQDALRDAGLKTLDGGIPTPTWSPERALAIMDEVGISGAVLSVSSPHLNFLAPARAITLARAINDYAAEIKRRHPDRFGAYAILPLPDVAASLAELERALDQLELDGVALPTHTEGRYLGHADLAPL